jgi:kynurenine formamidase
MSDLQIVDLSAVLSPSTVMWPGDEPMRATATDEIARDGSYSRQVTLGEHSGTHFDAPGHFAPGGALVDAVPAESLVLPVRVLDITHKTADDPHATLTVVDVDSHEERYGRIEQGSAVFLYTGWDDKRTDRDAYVGGANEMRFPGFGVAAAEALVVERGVVGLGIDTLSIDPGQSTAFEVHRNVSLPRGVWHLENLINLGQLPAVGAWVVVGVPRVAGASGFPARALGLVPKRS